MSGGYHRLSPQLMAERDKVIIRLASEGVKHKIIALHVRMQPTGVETRLQKLREEGKLPAAGGKNG